MTMSTASVFEESARRAKVFGLKVARLAPWLDVDTPEDLAELRRELESPATGERDACERTRAFLARSLGWLDRLPRRGR